MELDNPVQVKLKTKYTIGGKGQMGYKPPAGGGNNAVKRIKVKASEKMRKLIQASQPKRVLVLKATGKKVMENA